MKRKTIALLLAFVVYSTLAACNSANIRVTWKNTAACSIEPAAKEDLSLLTALYPDIEWTAYAQSAPLTVANDKFPLRTAQAAVLSFAGKPERIAFFPLIYGRLPFAGEAGACALDASTAYRLFNSINAVGGSIRLNGKTSPVVGVIDVNCPIMLIPADKDTMLVRLIADDRQTLVHLSSILGVEPDAFELSGAEISKLMWPLYAAPWLIIASFMLISLRRRGGWRRIAAGALIWALSLGILLAILWCAPVRLLPARWSDMEFYPQQLSAFRARAYRMPDIRDGMLRDDVLYNR